MVWPVAFPLEAFLTRAGITALGSTAASEGIKSLQNQGTFSPEMAREAFMRTLVGPTTEIFNRTTDTPSGKVFAPTGEIIEPNQIPGIAPPTEQPQGLPGLIATEQNRQLPGMDQATPPTQNKGFTMPIAEDMSILYKKAPEEQPTENVPTQEDNKFKIAYELDPKLIDEMLVARGGTKAFQEKMKTMAAPMPASTKDKMFPILADKLMAKYKFDQTDKYEKFEDIPKDELEILQKKYRTKLNAIDYIVSSVYDVIGGKKTNTERDTIFAVDNDGLPIAAVKLGSGEISGAKAKKTIAIEEAGSVFPEAMDRVLEDVKKLAKERGLKFIVAEDLTTDEGYEAFKKRGFKPTTSEKYKMFKGKKIRRPNGRVAYQKNLVFELD